MQQQKILTVTELNRLVKKLLEYDVGEVCIEGELSNLSKPNSGHLYFSLKDNNAQIRCAFFKNRQAHRLENLKDGQQVQVVGQLSLYEARGDYQLIVQHITEAGLGELYRQFEALKLKLNALGLFSQARKKNLPNFPMTIGVITSTSGAALQDIRTTLARRFPIATLLVYASEVQGKGAAPQLIQALAKANQDQRCDVLLLARGGGSIEDLWPFNDEQLAYAIAQSSIPVVSGVGHETDFTIADFVADLRAATPTAAAESITPNGIDLINTFDIQQQRLNAAIQRYFKALQMVLKHQLQTLRSPQQIIASNWQRFDYTCLSLQKTIKQHFNVLRSRHQAANNRLKTCSPNLKLKHSNAQLTALTQSLKKYFQSIQSYRQQSLKALTHQLLAYSPQATLERGYAIVTFENQIIRHSEQVDLQSNVQIRLAHGRLNAKVTQKKTEQQKTKL